MNFEKLFAGCKESHFYSFPFGQLAGCKESHFYSFPFGQAEANIYQPKHHFNYPQKRFDEQIDFTVPL